MNQPNILELIKNCDVEWKPLWEVTIWDKKFNAVDKAKQPKIEKYYYFLANELKPLVVKNGNVKILTTNISDLWTTEDLVGDKIKDGEIVAIPWGGNPIVQYYKGKFITSDNRIATSKDIKILNNKYLYYFMLSNIATISSFYRGSGIKHPSMYDVLEMQIPLPPLEIQQKIVKILDKFTELEATLEATLEAELTLRKKQYEFYRNQLLTFGDNSGRGGDAHPLYKALSAHWNGKVVWKSLGEVAENLDFMRKPVTNGLREKGDIPYYGASGIVDYVKDYIFDGDFLLVSEDGANLLARNSPIAFSISGKSWVNNHAHILKFNTYEERKFIEFYLNNMDLTPYISGAAQPKLNKKNLNSIPIPYLPFCVVQKIVEILDKFDTLIHSISDGLPREIELRRKQYEYYREQLLNF